jgi:hypothetical protein
LSALLQVWEQEAVALLEDLQPWCPVYPALADQEAFLGALWTVRRHLVVDQGLSALCTPEDTSRIWTAHWEAMDAAWLSASRALRPWDAFAPFAPLLFGLPMPPPRLWPSLPVCAQRANLKLHGEATSAEPDREVVWALPTAALQSPVWPLPRGHAAEALLWQQYASAIDRP